MVPSTEETSFLITFKGIYFWQIAQISHSITMGSNHSCQASSSINYFQCEVMYWSDWKLGWGNRFRSIRIMRLSRWWWMRHTAGCVPDRPCESKHFQISRFWVHHNITLCSNHWLNYCCSLYCSEKRKCFDPCTEMRLFSIKVFKNLVVSSGWKNIQNIH